MSGQPMALWSCRDPKDPPRVPRSAGNLAGCARRRAGRFARDLSGLGFRTSPTSGEDPGSSARPRWASERSGSPPAWRSRDDDRRARPHPQERGSRRTTLCHLRQANDVPAPTGPRDSRRCQSVSAAPVSIRRLRCEARDRGWRSMPTRLLMNGPSCLSSSLSEYRLRRVPACPVFRVRRTA